MCRAKWVDFFSIEKISGSGIDIGILSGISGYLIYSRVFPSMSGITEMLGTPKIPNISGYPILDDFQN